MMPGNCELSRRNDAVHRGAGVRIQYKNLYLTKTWGDTVLDLCTVYFGEMALTLTLYPYRSESHPFTLLS